MTEIAKPLGQWHEDDGNVLWWRFPITEPPYVGTPNDCPIVHTVRIDGLRVGPFHTGGWPGYHTHWTPLPPVPQEPK